jgi:hypothetical protein
METKTPDFPVARRAIQRAAGTAIGRCARRAALVIALVAVPGAAVAATVTVKGKTIGSGKLLNPVWNEAKDPNLHRYSFREPSATVRADVRTLTAFLPKELCIAALIDGEAPPFKRPYGVVVAGGRTTPVTLVVAKGQLIQFKNDDPFPHKLYVVGQDPKGFGPEETKPAGARSWTPPGPGKYEIRDQLAPSIRTWIVVEPHAAAVGYPDRKGEFQIDLEPGTYKLHAYFNGDPIGNDLDVKVTPAPTEQLLKLPLVVGEPGPGEAPPPPGKPGGPKGGGGG